MWAVPQMTDSASTFDFDICEDTQQQAPANPTAMTSDFNSFVICCVLPSSLWRSIESSFF
jgi:hypothetical protein